MQRPVAAVNDRVGANLKPQFRCAQSEALRCLSGNLMLTERVGNVTVVTLGPALPIAGWYTV